MEKNGRARFVAWLQGTSTLGWRVGWVVLIVGGVAVPFVARGLGPVPNTFAAGDVVSAGAINQDFEYLRAAIDAMEATAPGTLCGQTAETTGRITAAGGLVGFPAAAALCHDACSSPTAHACTNHEIMMAAQSGVSIPRGRFLSGSEDHTVPECAGFSLDDPSVYSISSSWHPDIATVPVSPAGAYPVGIACSMRAPMLCCD